MTRHGDMSGLGVPVEMQVVQAADRELAAQERAVRLSNAIRASMHERLAAQHAHVLKTEG